MIARVHSSILQGIDAIVGEVEADVARGGMPDLKLVGLPETAVKEPVRQLGPLTAAAGAGEMASGGAFQLASPEGGRDAT